MKFYRIQKRSSSVIQVSSLQIPEMRFRNSSINEVIKSVRMDRDCSIISLDGFEIILLC